MKLDHIQVARIDEAVGVLRGVAGWPIPAKLLILLGDVIPHVQAAARLVESRQREEWRVRMDQIRRRRRRRKS
jgi:hypothetical protein